MREIYRRCSCTLVFGLYRAGQGVERSAQRLWRQDHNEHRSIPRYTYIFIKLIGTRYHLYLNLRKIVYVCLSPAGDKPWDFVKVQLGSWTRAENYANNIIDVRKYV